VFFVFCFWFLSTFSVTGAISNNSVTRIDLETRSYYVQVYQFIEARFRISENHCSNPALTVKIEQNDHNSASEYLTVIDNFTTLGVCHGAQNECNTWSTCLNLELLDTKQLSVNDLYVVRVYGGESIDLYCTYAMHVTFSLFCNNHPNYTYTITTHDPAADTLSPYIYTFVFIFELLPFCTTVFRFGIILN
jgi:hypothetical protein